MTESYQKTLTHKRPPRVTIVYEIEENGAKVVRELPFVVGVMGDFTGNPETPLAPLKERKFIEIDRENFDQVLERLKPELHFRVNNTLKKDDTQFSVDLSFKKLDDFSPEAVVKQVPALKELLAMRDQLTELEKNSNKFPEFESLLEEILQNPEKIGQLVNEFKQEQKEDSTHE